MFCKQIDVMLAVIVLPLALTLPGGMIGIAWYLENQPPKGDAPWQITLR